MMTGKILNQIFHPKSFNCAASSFDIASLLRTKINKKTESNLISVCFGWRFDFWTSNMTEWLGDKFFTTSWIVSTIGRKQINMNTNDKFNVEKNKMENGKRIMGTGKKAEEWLVGLTSRQRNERIKMEMNAIWNMWHRKYVWFAFHFIG